MRGVETIEETAGCDVARPVVWEDGGWEALSYPIGWGSWPAKGAKGTKGAKEGADLNNRWKTIVSK